MKIVFRKFLIILVSLSLLLSACGTPPVESVNWNTAVPVTEMAQVAPSDYLEEGQLSYPTPGIRPVPSQPPQVVVSEQTEFCDGNPQHECSGDEQGGWRGIYASSNNLRYIEYFIPGDSFTIQYSNGKYFLSCSGMGGDQQEVTEGFVNNLRTKIETLNAKRDEYEKASQDASSGVGWAVGGGVVTCGVGIVIAGVTAGWGWPAVVAGCGGGFAAGFVGGMVTEIGSGNAQTSRAEEELATAQNDLNNFVQSVCP